MIESKLYRLGVKIACVGALAACAPATNYVSPLEAAGMLPTNTSPSGAAEATSPSVDNDEAEIYSSSKGGQTADCIKVQYGDTIYDVLKQLPLPELSAPKVAYVYRSGKLVIVYPDANSQNTTIYPGDEICNR
jgi:hypothetical protein